MSINLVKLAINCLQCNVFIFKTKRGTDYKYCKIKLFSGTISDGGLMKLLRTKECFAKIVNG